MSGTNPEWTQISPGNSTCSMENPAKPVFFGPCGNGGNIYPGLPEYGRFTHYIRARKALLTEPDFATYFTHHALINPARTPI